MLMIVRLTLLSYVLVSCWQLPGFWTLFILVQAKANTAFRELNEVLAATGGSTPYSNIQLSESLGVKVIYPPNF